MTKFQVNDAAGIKEYIKSLDAFEQFDEVFVLPVESDPLDSSRIRVINVIVKSDDRKIYEKMFNRDFFEPEVEFSQSFEDEMKALSASVLFGRQLLRLDDSMAEFSVEAGYFYNLVTAYDNSTSYELRVSLRADLKPISHVKIEFCADSDLIRSYHTLENKAVIDIEELESVVNEFARLKAALRKKGN